MHDAEPPGSLLPIYRAHLLERLLAVSRRETQAELALRDLPASATEHHALTSTLDGARAERRFLTRQIDLLNEQGALNGLSLVGRCPACSGIVCRAPETVEDPVATLPLLLSWQERGLHVERALAETPLRACACMRWRHLSVA